MNDFWRAIQPVRTTSPNILRALLTAAVCLLAVGIEHLAHAQPTPEQIRQFREMRGRRGSPSMHAQPASPPQEKKPEKKEDKKDDKKEDDKKKEDEGVKTIKRPTDDSANLDPNRMRLKPDKNGLVQFNYHGQPWADVLQEFADAANLTFDWQELPADNLNLVTQKKYNLQQARDLLNSRLLARGFTLVRQGELLSAVKIEKLDPSLIPRVEADELEDYPPHDFVRVRFQLPESMEPDKAKDDVKVLLSPNAKVTPLLNTKRLLVIDSVANLRSVRDLIYAEQSAADSILKPEIYPIRHRRADYVAEQVMIVLGLDPSSRKKPQELQLEQQRMQLYMQMQQKGKDVSKLLRKDGPPVHVAVDVQQNTILINAPPELLPTIERTIKQFDQPTGAQLAGISGTRSMRRHNTGSASTDAVVTALMEIGQLDPMTQLQSDKDSSTIFAFATDEDHTKIERMIGKFDGSGRQIHVIWLRRLPVRQVAGTLMTLLVGDEPKKEENNSRRRFSFYGMSEPEKKEEVGFKALPDAENNRLLLWANDDELAEVKKMLVQMGESPDGRSNDPSKVRILRAGSSEETARLLESLRRAYPGKLNIRLPEQPAAEPAKPESTQPEQKVTRRSPLGSANFLTAQLENSSEKDSSDSAVSHEAPPINIVVTEDGRIVVSSDDPAALNEFESLVEALAPPREEFHKFALTHASALNVVFKLEQYFADELKDQTESVFDEWGEYQGEKEKKLGRANLGRRELLRFVDDRYTNTVIVQGASPSQLTAIEQLIKVYDQPPKSDINYYSRKTEVIPLKYSRAEDIAKSLKEVYRELLSSKDKEFQDKEGNQPLSGRAIPYAFGEVVKNKRGEDDPVLIEFEGVLSIGVDQVSNTLIVSARAEVLKDIRDTVETLDNAARPNTEIRVHRVRGLLPAGQLQKMLKDSMSNPWPGGKPRQASPQSNGGNQRSDDGRSSSERRRSRRDR